MDRRKFIQRALLSGISLPYLCSAAQAESTAANLEMGADISMLKAIQDTGFKYKLNGKVMPALSIFDANGFSYMRLRLFHTPNGEGPIVNDLKYTIELAQQIKEAGFKYLLDFHYSDTWADPGKQFKPKAWENLSLGKLGREVHDYTKHVISEHNKHLCTPDMVQIGNEIGPGMLWPEGQIHIKGMPPNWNDFTYLLKAGIIGLKRAEPTGRKIDIMIHVAGGGEKEFCNNFYKKMLEYKVPFDAIGVSYYPWWHGTFAKLSDNLKSLSYNFDKNIYIVEATYPFAGDYPIGTCPEVPYPITVQGQADFFAALIKTIKDLNRPNIKGLFYWAPEWVAINGLGTGWGNKTLFDKNGNALPAMKVFKQ